MLLLYKGDSIVISLGLSDKECRSSNESIRESSGDGDNRLTTVSNGVSFGNWTTVSLLCVDHGSLMSPVWKSGKLGHSKDWTTWRVDCWLLEARFWWLWGSSRQTNKLMDWYNDSWCGQSYLVCKSLLLILSNCIRRNNKRTKKQKRNIIRSFSSFGNFCAHCIGPNKNSIQTKTKKYKTNNKQINKNDRKQVMKNFYSLAWEAWPPTVHGQSVGHRTLVLFRSNKEKASVWKEYQHKKLRDWVKVWRLSTKDTWREYRQVWQNKV